MVSISLPCGHQLQQGAELFLVLQQFLHLAPLVMLVVVMQRILDSAGNILCRQNPDDLTCFAGHDQILDLLALHLCERILQAQIYTYGFRNRLHDINQRRSLKRPPVARQAHRMMFREDACGYSAGDILDHDQAGCRMLFDQRKRICDRVMR